LDKARKIIIFSLTRSGCIEYTIELLRAFVPYSPIVYVNNSVADKYNSEVRTLRTYTGFLTFIFSTFLFFFKSKKIIQHLKKENSSIAIYLTSFHFWNYLLAVRAKKEKIPCYLTVHDYKTHRGEKSKFVEWVQKETMKSATKIIFLSISESKKALGENFQQNKIFHLPHPIFKGSSLNKLPHNKKPNLLFVGRLKEYKGIQILNEAIKDLNIEKLTIAGAGKTTTPSNSKIKLYNNYISDEQLNQLLCSHEILVLPYLEATQSGILSLGLSKNIVMIISKLPGLEEQVSSASCLWIEPNAQSLKNAIQSLIDDESLYKRVKENAKTEKENFEKEWRNTFLKLINQISSH